MVMVSGGATSVRSKAPAPSKEETPPAVHPGLAGAASGSSYVRRADNTPLPTSQVDPRIAVKASDLQDRGRAGATDEPLKFDLTPERPKLGPMSGVNYIGFLPGVHWNLTFHAALDAGLPFGRAMELADLVVKVDDLPRSQDPDHAYMHAMRAPGETMEHYNAASQTYEATLRAMKSKFGLAGLLHRMQDSYSKSHTGPHGPLEWHGHLNEGLFKLLWHAWMDTTPPSDVQRDMIQKGAALIKEYVNQCGGTLNQ
jgi:hypothetical protein